MSNVDGVTIAPVSFADVICPSAICIVSIEPSTYWSESTEFADKVSTPVSARVASPDITLSMYLLVPVSYNKIEPSAGEVILVSLSPARVEPVTSSNELPL